MNTNPLLDFSGLPRFDAITHEHVTPAIDTLLAQARATVAQLEAPMEEVSWENFVAPRTTSPKPWAAPGASSTT